MRKTVRTITVQIDEMEDGSFVAQIQNWRHLTGGGWTENDALVALLEDYATILKHHEPIEEQTFES